MKSKWSDVNNTLEKISNSNDSISEKVIRLQRIGNPLGYFSQTGNQLLELLTNKELLKRHGYLLIDENLTDNKPYLINAEEYHYIFDSPFEWVTAVTKSRYGKVIKDKNPLTKTELERYITGVQKTIWILQTKHDDIIHYLIDNEYEDLLANLVRSSDRHYYPGSVEKMVPTRFYEDLDIDLVKVINMSVQTDLLDNFQLTQALSSVPKETFEDHMEKGLY